jgi:hypothetical protein
MAASIRGNDEDMGLSMGCPAGAEAAPRWCNNARAIARAEMPADFGFDTQPLSHTDTHARAAPRGRTQKTRILRTEKRSHHAALTPR